MPRGSKRRKKRRHQATQASLPANDGSHGTPVPDTSASRTAVGLSPEDKTLSDYRVGDIVSGTVTSVDSPGILVDVDGVTGVILDSDLPLADGRAPADLYSQGEHLADLFVWGIAHGQHALALSVRRNTPGYADALDSHSVGDIVSGTITDVSSDGIWVNVNGVIGLIRAGELLLADGQVPSDLYSAGNHMAGLFLGQINDDRSLALSVRRNSPGYTDTLASHSVGDIVSGTILEVLSVGILVIVNGVIGQINASELLLADGQVPSDLYSAGEHMADLFLWQINDSRSLALSVRRNSPGYADALASYSVGNIVSGTITSVHSTGIQVDVNGVIGFVNTFELPLAEGQIPSDLYSAGEHMADLFLWQINDNRSLALSVRRNTPSYADALDNHSVGDIVSGTITNVSSGGIWVNVNGIIGWIFADELPLADGQTPAYLYAIGDHLPDLFIWQIDREARDFLLSNRPRHDEDGPHIQGQQIKAVVRGDRSGGINVLVANTKIFIPNHELDCSPEQQLHFERNTKIDVVVLEVGNDGLANRLSHRRTLDTWVDQTNYLITGGLVSNAVVIPKDAMPDDEQRVAVDLGPITGYIREEEFSPADAAEYTSFNANRPLGVVIESVDHEEGSAIVSLENFDARYQELADGISENNECDAILRWIARNIAVFDLGSGLLGEMAWEPSPGAPAIVSFEDIGKTIPVRVTEVDRAGHFIRLDHRDQEIHQLVMRGESQSLEFKASLRRSPRTGEDDPKASYGVLKSIVGFLNSWDGGTLIIGVDDAGAPIIGEKGAIDAIAVDGYDDEDEMLRALKDQIKNRIGASVFDLLDISFIHYRDTRIIRVDCSPAEEETWLKGGRSGKSKEEEIFLRMPASTDRLMGRDLVDFVKQRFGARGRPEVTSNS